jgi:hypothetical protein
MATLSKSGDSGGSNRGGSGRGGGGGGGSGSGGGGTMTAAIVPLEKEKKLCPNCNKTVVHKPADCFSLEANKNKRSAGWGLKWGKLQGPESSIDDCVQQWISKNKPQHLLIPTPLHNYWTPLASQVKELDDWGDVHKPGGTAGYQAHPRLMCLSVRLSVISLLSFLREIA